MTELASTPVTSAPSGRASRRDRVGLGVLLAATFMGQVDGFIVNVASPAIQADLHAGFDQIQLIGAGYVLAFAAGLITGARLGDRAGRKTVFLYGVAAFSLASLLCGLAPSAELLIAARFGQGASAALMVPQVLSILRVTFTDASERARAVSRYGMAIGLGVICGVAGGGILVQLDLAGLGWRPVLLVNVPIGLCIVLVGARTIRESRSGTGKRLDLAGAGLTMAGLPALLVPLVFWPRDGWSPWLAASALLAVLVGVALVVQQRRVASRGGDPLFPPRVLAARGMPLRLGIVAVFFAGNSGLFLVFTYYVQTGLLVDPLTAGLMFVPMGLGFMLGSSVTHPLSARLGTRVPVAGAAILAGALLLMAVAAHTPPDGQPVLLTVLIGIAGLGQGLVAAPLIAGMLSRVAPADAGALSGLATTVTQIGLALGVAVAGTFYRTVLGGVPGDPNDPIPWHGNAVAFTSTAALLAVVAGATSLLIARQDPRSP